MRASAKLGDLRRPKACLIIPGDYYSRTDSFGPFRSTSTWATINLPEFIERVRFWGRKHPALFMGYTEFVTRPVTDRHIIIRPEPHPVRPLKTTAVPEGGATVLFVLAALTAMVWAAVKRYGVRVGGKN
ncbi:MAG: hypothetical protein ABR880_03510 [Candidatus Sulfotelmatobacter sp.]